MPDAANLPAWNFGTSIEPPRLARQRFRRDRDRRVRWPLARHAIPRFRPLGHQFPRPCDPARHFGDTPDTSVIEQQRAQPEFTEAVWQYINRRCSDWRVITGKERAKEYADLLARLEKDYGIDRYILLGLWGMESSFGDVIVNPNTCGQ
jgi:hypothetical protein